MKEKYEDPLNVAVAVGSILLFIIAPKTGSDPYPWNYIAAAVGWIYFCAWSVSFYPQIFWSLQRKSCIGLSTDFVVLNLIGFLSYTVYTCSFYFVDSLDGSLVSLSDVFFAVNSFACCAFNAVVVFCLGFDREPMTLFGKIVSCGLILVFIIAFVSLNYKSFLETVGSIKVVVTLTKYAPQVYMNYLSKSTDGMSMHTIKLDFLGGFLSLTQLIIDSIVLHAPNLVFGNPIKLALALLSLVFDIIYFIQHYSLYSDSYSIIKEENSPLMDSSQTE